MPVTKFGRFVAAASLSASLLFAGLAQSAPEVVGSAPPIAAKLFPDSRMIARGRFAVEVVGRGPDLIFIPGLASSRENWRATAERLRGRYRLHLIHVAGFAGEPARDNASGDVLISTAEAIDAYIVEQKLAPAVLIGHSLGGTTALYLAIHHPEHLKKILVVDALPFFGALIGGPQASVQSLQPMADMIRANAGKGPGQDNTKMLEAMVSSPADRAMVIGWSKISDPGVVGRAFADDITLDLRPDLASIRTPITLLYPDEVPTGAPAGAMDGVYDAAFAAVPNKTLIRVDNSRHFIMLDQPAAFAAQLDAFLAK